MPTTTGEKPTEPRGTVPRPSGKRYKEADQSGRENRLSHRDRRLPSTGGERDLQTARPAKPAELPDRPRRSPHVTVRGQARMCLRRGRGDL
jgi:hypothetical protein